ncbi:aminotransferase class V-fold PLP-dependent enzyme [Flammeovirga pacifica]|uniref:Aminotransferase class V domain-containing protein n=1 Tax=Flammeovirga pacifica TaxID=915059 RepID=A0A1S1YZA5_FLAPC|nr:aminotransferase class V-fold PLP-dependent enzyme [Flammeovirga pacifica]OHX66339.1 hypothetical protein NH26_08230 [Flammeovirga pacifica]
MISFYPGPSKIAPDLDKYMQEAYDEGILSCNHRSPSFMQLMEECLLTIRKKLDLPKNYEVFFVSSATECWEITAQSYHGKKFMHIYNGAFGEKWSKYNQVNDPITYEFPLHKNISLHQLSQLGAADADILCLTACETSNTTFIHPKTFQKIKKRFPNPLIFIDATSSMSGLRMDWKSGDLWYASVQKCFGLPSGLGVMICSPKALSKINKKDTHYNNLWSIYKNQQKRQTTHTPNILGIYLLNKVLQHRPDITTIDITLKKRMKETEKFFKKLGYEFLVPVSRLRSPTVLGIKTSKEKVQLLKKLAKEHQITLGNGYGAWKETSFRIANFPAHTDNDYDKIKDFFKKIEKV